VRRRLAEPDPERRALDRLAWVHATSGLGDALVAVALAGTLFFSVPVAAARPRVALYLLITVAPFAVVAPLLGRLLDGRSGASRVAMIVALISRAVLGWLAATRLDGLLLFPLAFGLLVFSRVHGISRSALVPELVAPGRDLVPINSRMARVIAIGGTVGGLLGVAVQKLLGGGGVLHLAAAVFLIGGFMATAVPSLADAWHRAARPEPDEATRSAGEPAGRAEGGAADAEGAAAGPARRGAAAPGRTVGRWPVARIRLARTASAATRAAGGFVLFLLAFALRNRGVSTAGLGLLVAGIGAGGLIGAFLVPRLGRRLREEGLLAFGLGLSAVTSLVLAGRVGVATAGLAGLITGTAASAARLGFESLVQRDVPSAIRATTITRSETVFQLSWVLGAVIPVALPLPADQGLLAVGAACVLAVAVYLIGLMRLRNGSHPQAARSRPAPRPEAHGQ
jgi:MFS family permease